MMLPTMLEPGLNDLAEAIHDFRDTPFQSSESVLKRFVYALDEEPVSGFLGSVLPVVDFNSWWASAEATGGAIAGSKSLDWPADRSERVALQIAFIRALAEGQIRFFDILIGFFRTHSVTDVSFAVQSFADRLLDPVLRDIRRLTEQRPIPPVLFEAMGRLPPSGDVTLDEILRDACRKFKDPAPAVRRDAVEKLWDAWERLKTLDNASDKKLSVKELLDSACSEPNFRNLLEAEAVALTKTGNDFQIRHFEASKTPVPGPAEFEYLFHRLYALIHYLLFSRPPAA
jgi:hypothetical protein